MKKNNKKLLNLTFSELNIILGCLNTMYDAENEEEREEALDDLFYLTERATDLCCWLDEKFDMYDELEKNNENEYLKQFEKDYDHYIGCTNCDNPDPDYYMVKDEIWEEFGCKEGFLCIPCLEEKMGRKLVKEDFTDCPANDKCEAVKELRKMYN